MTHCPTSHENIIRIICMVLTFTAYCVAYGAVFSFLTASLGFMLSLLVWLVMATISWYFTDVQLNVGNTVATKLGDAAVPAYMFMRNIFVKPRIA